MNNSYIYQVEMQSAFDKHAKDFIHHELRHVFGKACLHPYPAIV